MRQEISYLRKLQIYLNYCFSSFAALNTKATEVKLKILDASHFINSKIQQIDKNNFRCKNEKKTKKPCY